VVASRRQGAAGMHQWYPREASGKEEGWWVSPRTAVDGEAVQATSGGGFEDLGEMNNFLHSNFSIFEMDLELKLREAFMS
jgi:hypothetical protein